MPRGFTWQGSGHFQITRIIGRQPFKFKFWTDDELRSEGSSVDLEQRLWIDKKISRIIFKPHSEVGLVSWTSLFKTFFNQGLILEPSSLTIVVHSTVGFIVLVTVGKNEKLESPKWNWKDWSWKVRAEVEKFVAKLESSLGFLQFRQKLSNFRLSNLKLSNCPFNLHWVFPSSIKTFQQDK